MSECEIEFEKALRRAAELHGQCVRKMGDCAKNALALQRQEHARCVALEAEVARLQAEVANLRMMLSQEKQRADNAVAAAAAAAAGGVTGSQRLAVPPPVPLPPAAAAGGPNEDMLELRDASRRLFRELDSVDREHTSERRETRSDRIRTRPADVTPDILQQQQGYSDRNWAPQAKKAPTHADVSGFGLGNGAAAGTTTPGVEDILAGLGLKRDAAAEARTAREAELRHQLLSMPDFDSADDGTAEATQPPLPHTAPVAPPQQLDAGVLASMPTDMAYRSAGVLFLFYSAGQAWALLQQQGTSGGRLAAFCAMRTAADRDRPALTAARALAEDTGGRLRVAPARLLRCNRLVDRAAGLHMFLYLYSQAVDTAALPRVFRAVPARSLSAAEVRARLDERLARVPGFWDLLAREIDRMERVCFSRSQKQHHQQQQQRRGNGHESGKGFEWKAP